MDFCSARQLSPSLGLVQPTAGWRSPWGARYYEAWKGRFLSEYPAMDGANWYVYCSNDPVNKVDSTGESEESEFMAIVGDLYKIIGLSLLGVPVCIDPSATARAPKVLTAAHRTAKVAGQLLKANAIKKLMLFAKALQSSKALQRSPSTRLATASIVAGYMMVIYGYLMEIVAEGLDPYASNKGLTEFL